MIREFRYRIEANEQILNNAEHWLELCRILYNSALAERIYAYKMQGISLSRFDQQDELSEMKKENSEYKLVNAWALQDVISRLDKAYKTFFRRVEEGHKNPGFPRFKGRGRYNSFTLNQNGLKLNGKFLTISHVGRFKIRLSRRVEGNVKTVTIVRSSTNKWYVCFSCDEVPEKRLPLSDKIVGIDVGIKSFCVDSDGNKFDNQRFFSKSENRIAYCQRRKDRRIKGSNRGNKARILLAKSHDKISNQRNDFLHKTANYYIENYGTICFETLDISDMKRNHDFAKGISDSGWGIFYGFCSYKAEDAGRNIIRIPRYEPTSKTCSNCLAINEDLTINDRQWVCRSCGVLHDGDYNAAKNILRVGQTLQEMVS
jgi:putative transposase